jgi:hypothetical protein
MNKISKNPLSSLGYGFINPQYIPRGKNEYYLRNIQHRSKNRYRSLTSPEIRQLEKNANSSDDWSRIQVVDGFDGSLVKNCAFYGLIRIGRLEKCFREFNNLRMPVGLYNSTIISCDIGDNVVIDNVNFMSHYIVGNDVMLVNIHEIGTTDHSKFGNGVLKEGEKESVRVWIEICNENAGRSILPFNGMQAGDAWLWSKYRDDDELLARFKMFTDQKFDTRRGYYGKIGDRTVIKNCSIIKDVWIGSDAYVKGANKLKNLTINSSPEAKSQIGEGCELVNGIIGFGCRIFYGVKAVRFMLGSNSQLKYGARLINSYLGDNSTISCCEVLNSLIFPAHEQHHNNSFLCAATVFGQSNMAAGATIGSNHNSRGADGEIIAGRGFWPALCVSLKHNSKFASFTLVAKGDFPSELNISIPFSLVSNDVSRDRLQVMPAYWLRYNMYALTRNVGKYKARDKRPDKTQVIEYDFLAPDSINEIMESYHFLLDTLSKVLLKNTKAKPNRREVARFRDNVLSGELEKTKIPEILVTNFENSSRPTELLRVPEAIRVFRDMVIYYAVEQILLFIGRKKIRSWEKLQAALPTAAVRIQWKNIGGQLIPEKDVSTLIRNIRSGKISSWDELHEYYKKKSDDYTLDKFRHAWASLLEILDIPSTRFSKKIFSSLLTQALITREKMVEGIYESRAKDFQNEFRRMVYDNDAEMEKVLGRLDDNSFIREQKKELESFRSRVEETIETFK